jgi:hypothetical protein
MGSGSWTSDSGSRRSLLGEGAEEGRGGMARRGWRLRCARQAGMFEGAERWVCGGIGAYAASSSCSNFGLLYIALIADRNESGRFLGSVQSP